MLFSFKCELLLKISGERFHSTTSVSFSFFLNIFIESVAISLLFLYINHLMHISETDHINWHLKWVTFLGTLLLHKNFRQHHPLLIVSPSLAILSNCGLSDIILGKINSFRIPFFVCYHAWPNIKKEKVAALVLRNLKVKQ